MNEFLKKLFLVVGVILFSIVLFLIVEEVFEHPYASLGITVLSPLGVFPFLYIKTSKRASTFQKWFFVILLDILAVGFAAGLMYVFGWICFSVCPDDAIIWISGAVASALFSVGFAAFFTLRTLFRLSFLRLFVITAIILTPFMIYGGSWIISFLD